MQTGWCVVAVHGVPVYGLYSLLQLSRPRVQAVHIVSRIRATVEVWSTRTSPCRLVLEMSWHRTQTVTITTLTKVSIPGRPKPQLQLTSICVLCHPSQRLCVHVHSWHMGPHASYVSQPLLSDECPPTSSTGRLYLMWQWHPSFCRWYIEIGVGRSELWLTWLNVLWHGILWRLAPYRAVPCRTAYCTVPDLPWKKLLVVVRWSRSTRLLYTGPSEYWDGWPSSTGISLWYTTEPLNRPQTVERHWALLLPACLSVSIDVSTYRKLSAP